MKELRSKLMLTAMKNVDEAITLLQHSQQRTYEAELSSLSSSTSSDLYRAEQDLRGTLKGMGAELADIRAVEEKTKARCVDFNRSELLEKYISADDSELNQRDFLRLVAERIVEDLQDS